MRQQYLFFLPLVMGFALLAALAFCSTEDPHPAWLPPLRCNSQELANSQPTGPPSRPGHQMRIHAICLQRRHQYRPDGKPLPLPFRSSPQVTAGGIDVLGSLQDKGDDDGGVLLAEDIERILAGRGEIPR